MDSEFEQRYQAAERAYGLGDFSEAHTLASGLWDQLQTASANQDQGQDQGIVLGWRSVVSLLMGHIQLHGLHNPEDAASAYQRVLDGESDATLAALAAQGLDRCRSQTAAGEGAATTAPAAHHGAIPELLKDPFLPTEPDQAKPERPNLVTAMPWLASAGDTSEPRREEEKKGKDEKEEEDEEKAQKTLPAAAPAPSLTTAPVPSPEPETEREPDPEPEPETTLTPEPQITTDQTPTDQPPNKAVAPTPQAAATKDLLENSWIRRQLKPELESPTDSTEPMGLINRIKRAFARSAGR